MNIVQKIFSEIINSEIFLNLFIGLVASVATLIGDRFLARWKIERRVRRIAGNYRIEQNSSNRDTSNETITIEHIGERRFSIRSVGSSVGDWDGTFVISETNPEYGVGGYRHQSYQGWGNHEFQFEPQTHKIYVYGENKDRVGAITPFSYTLKKVAV